MGWMTVEQGFGSWWEQTFLSSPPRQARLIYQPHIQLVSATFYPAATQPGHEDDYSPSSSVEVKNMWIYTSTSPCLPGEVLN
jgi:hypothetical protein